MLLKILFAPHGPTRRHLHGSAHPSRVRGVFGAFIKGHDDVRPQPDLRPHRALRAEEMRGTVEMRPKYHALLIELPQFAEAEDLKPTRVGQDGTIPRHKPM